MRGEAALGSIRLSPAGTNGKRVLYALAAIVVFGGSVHLLELDFIKFLIRIGNAPAVLRRMMTLDFTDFGEVLFGLGTSLALALVALVGGAAVSLILAFLSAENIAPIRIFARLIKAAIALVRAVPALVWVLMVVASIGFGNTGGMIGLMFPVAGYLTKSFTASVEDMGGDLIEALRATGAPWLNIVTKGILPTAFPAFMGWIAIRVEANVAESISLGMVGISGIGMILARALKQYNYGRITCIMLLIFATMLLLEFAMNHIRKLIRSRI